MFDAIHECISVYILFVLVYLTRSNATGINLNVKAFFFIVVELER